MIPTIEWHGNQIRMIDQRKIPAKIEWYVCRGYVDVIKAIEKMVIRGAPAIGVAAAMGLALGAGQIRNRTYVEFKKKFDRMAKEMAEARPTAVNLSWSVKRMRDIVEGMALCSVKEIKGALKKESQDMLDEDIAINVKMGKAGQKLIRKNAAILTHCSNIRVMDLK